MKERLLKVSKIAGIVLGVSAFITAGAVYWLTGTESGTRFALQRAQALMPAGVDLGTAHGRLAGDFELANVAIAGDGFEMKIARLWLSWSPADLLSRRLRIADLGAEGVRYRALPGGGEDSAPAPGQAPFSLPERVDLPVSVLLQRFSIKDVEAVLSPDAEPVAVQRVLLTDASFADTKLELGAIVIESSLLSAEGRAAITAAGGYPLDAHLEWEARPPGYAALAGETSVGGTMAEFVFEQRIAAPYSLALTGRVRNMLQPDAAPDLALDLAVEDLRLADVQADLPDMTFSLDALIEGSVDALETKVQASGIDPAQRRFTANAAAAVTPDAVMIRELTLRQPGRDGVLEGSGRVALADEASADLSIRWSALQWPLTGEPIVVSPRGSLDFEGPLSGYRLSVDTRLEPMAAPPVELRLSGEGDMTSIAVMLEAQERAGTFTGQVDAVWSPGVSAEVSLDAENYDPSPFAPDWPGAIDLALQAAVSVEGEDVAVTMSRLEAGGTLRGQALDITAEGRLERSGERYLANIERLRAVLGDAWFEVDGHIGQEAEIDWRLASDDLSALLPQAAGTIQASGRVSGPIPQARVAARIEGRGLAFGEHRIAIADVEADLDLAGRLPSDLTVTARDALVAGTPVDSLLLEAAGTAADHDVRLAVDAEPGRVALSLNGTAAEPWGESPSWQFTLAEGELAYASLAPWRLAAPAAGSVDAGQLILELQCWQTAEAELCLHARRDAAGIAAGLNLEALSFGYFAGLLPEDMGVSGTASIDARVTRPPDAPLSARAVVALSATEVRLPIEGSEDGTATVRIEPSEISLALNETGMHATAALNLEHGSVNLEAQSSADSASAPLAEQDLTGRVELTFPDLSFVSTFVPALEEFAGTLGGTLELAGTVGEPAVTGAVRFENGAMSVPETGITVTDLQAQLEGRGRDGIVLSASAVSGGGKLGIDGTMSLPGAPLTARLDIEGNAFQVVDNADAIVFLSPDLRVEADAGRMAVTGAVHVPRAELTPGEQAPSAVTVSDDQVLLSENTEAETPAARDLFAEIRVSLGDEVYFAGFGLAARFEGELLVEQEPRTPTTATGELRILDGEYRAYGQGLVIDSGRVYFAGGPVTQPALDVRAVRRPREGILVGADVKGPLESPSFALFSEPSMTQQEQLAWLVLGRSLEDAPEGQENALSQAVLAMGLKGGDFLAKNIGERVGFDQIGIETGSGEAGAPSDPGAAALVVGKYLSPKLYVSYGIGLFTPESVIEMQYEVSKNWTIITQSTGESTGGDVLYTVEFGE